MKSLMYLFILKQFSMEVLKELFRSVTLTDRI